MELPIYFGNPGAEAFFKFQAFSIATVENDRLLQRIKAALAGNLKRGETQKSFEEIVNEEFKKAGVDPISPWHLNTVWRTNTAMAYSGGQIAQMAEVKDEFPFWRYVTAGDERVRTSHKELNEKIFRNGDYEYWPPLDFNCRCDAILISRSEAEALSVTQPTDKSRIALNESAATFVGNKNARFLEWLKEKLKTSSSEGQTLIEEAMNQLSETL